MSATPETVASTSATSAEHARSQIEQIDLTTILLLMIQWLVFLGNIGLYLSHSGPTLLHIVVGIIPIHLAFTIWHEAAHGNISKDRRINNVVGVLGMFPYMTPYFLQRYVHLDHHKHLNQEGLDPNLIYADGPFWQLPFRYIRAVKYARQKLAADPRNPGMRRSDTVGLAALAGVWLLALWTGHFVQLLLVWFVPLVIGKIIMDWYINYLPHVGLAPHRFLGTRIVHVRWLTPLVLQHNYHAIHHLWPSIPWHQYLRTFHHRLEYLTDHEVPIETRLVGGRTYPQPDAGDK